MQMPDSFDFDRIIDRRASNCEKWSAPEQFLSPQQCAADPLPMWVADMDFQTAPVIRQALREAIDFGIFGYSAAPTKAYLDAVSGWQLRRFGWEIAHDWIVPMPGTIATIKNAIQAFSAPGDTVLIQPPVYVHFHNDPVLNGRFVTHAPLPLEGRHYRFDAALFEQAIRPNTKLFILSNPQNPTGNVWSEADLRVMGEICERHGIVVISDEVHQDFIMNPACRHIPFASLGERFAQNSISCIAPSKTFNLAGLSIGNAVIANKRLREDFRRHLARNNGGAVGQLGMIAAEAAYDHGEPWLEQLLSYIRGNHRHFASQMAQITDRITVLPADSLYLAWMDCRGLGLSAGDLNAFMLTKARLWLDQGTKFGIEGAGFMRINLGCPRATLDEALNRLRQALA